MAYNDARTSTWMNQKEYITFIYYPSLNIAEKMIHHLILTNQLYASLSPGCGNVWRRMAERTPNEESIETTYLYTPRSKCAPFFNSASETVVNPENLQPSAKATLGTLHILKLRRNQALESLVGHLTSSWNVEINHPTLLSEGKMHKIQLQKPASLHMLLYSVLSRLRIMAHSR